MMNGVNTDISISSQLKLLEENIQPSLKVKEENMHVSETQKEVKLCETWRGELDIYPRG